MKKQKRTFKEPDLSRWHILSYDELLKVNGGSGSDSGDDDSTDTATESTAETSEDSDSDTYTVQSGDTLSEITEVYNDEHGTNYSYQEVADANGIENADVIHPGDEIDFSGLGEGKEEGQTGEEAKDGTVPSDDFDSETSDSGCECDVESNGYTENGKTAADGEAKEADTAAKASQNELPSEENNKNSLKTSVAHEPKSTHNEKSGHSIWSTIADKFYEAKNWLADQFSGKLSNKSGDTIVVRPENPKEYPYTLLKNGDTYKGNVDGIIFPDGTVEKTNGKSNYTATTDEKGNYVVIGGEYEDAIFNFVKSVNNCAKAGLESLGINADSLLRDEDMYTTYHYDGNAETFLNGWLSSERNFDIDNDGIIDTTFVPIPLNDAGGVPSKENTLSRWNGFFKD